MAKEPLRLMCIFAHPDDESLGTGGILARYADEGVETYLLTATRGEGGWRGEPQANPGQAAVGQMREQELRAAADVLGLREVVFLDYIDGELNRAENDDILPKIVAHLRRIRPQVVVTFDPFGVYGHPDHIAISQFTLAAVTLAAIPTPEQESQLPPHTVRKLYFVAETETSLEGFQSVMGKIRMPVNGEDRFAVGWPDWAVSARIDTREYWGQVVRAIECHQSQQLNPADFAAMPARFGPEVWGIRTLYRAFSLVGSSSTVESDLFEGLRS
jgi:LmbE family N-acetylglucosaminyl deacetylase